MEREVHRTEGDAGPAVDVERHAVADRRRAVGKRGRRPRRRWRPRTSSCVPSGVAISIVRPIDPSRATRPARIFVPPRSTPITRSSCIARLRYPPGCPNKRSPTGCTRAVGQRAESRCSVRRAVQREDSGAGTHTASSPKQRRCRPPHHAGDRDRSPPRHRVARCELPLLLARHLGRERARARTRARRADHPGRPPLLDPDDDPRPRHRRREPVGPRRRQPLRLDHADPHRSGQAPARVPLDPARPAGRDPRLRAPPRSTRRSRSAARRSRSGR